MLKIFACPAIYYMQPGFECIKLLISGLVSSVLLLLLIAVPEIPAYCAQISKMRTALKDSKERYKHMLLS